MADEAIRAKALKLLTGAEHFIVLIADPEGIDIMTSADSDEVGQMVEALSECLAQAHMERTRKDRSNELN